MSFETIQFEVAEGVGCLTLNRPKVLNSITLKMHHEVRTVLDAIPKDEAIRCLVITGKGQGFCAGQDLAERKEMPGEGPIDLGDSLDHHYNPLVRQLRSLEVPVVCAVNGVAAGAGANIALACDIVLAARSASFIQSFCRLGLVPDSGGTWVLPRLVGHARALGLSLLGDQLGAERAEQWGLIWKCVDNERLLPDAFETARRLASLPTAGLARIKRAFGATFSHTLDQQLDFERDLQQAAGRSAEYRGRVTAFLEKRRPVQQD